jgi:predicted transcriptional regulator
MEQTTVSTAEAIRLRRMRLGMTQGELARSAGYRPDTVRLLEQGWRPRKGAALRAVLDALDRREAQMTA